MGHRRLLGGGANFAGDLVRRALAAMRDLQSIQARGELVATIASLLQGVGVQSVAEFSDLLGLFAVVVAEDCPDEGQILAYWASVVRDQADAPCERPA